MAYKLTIEIPFGICYLVFAILGNVVINFMMYKTCYNTLHYPEEDCLRVGIDTDNYTKSLEKEITPIVGTMVAIQEMAPLVIPVVWSLMLSSWSDKFGRKPILCLVFICMTISQTIYVLLISFKELNPWWFLLCAIPGVISGGMMTLFTMTFAYINDISTLETRGIRMVIIDFVQMIASLVGGLSSSYLLEATSYQILFGICALLIAIAAAYTYFFCPESLENKSDEKPNLRSLFQLTNLTELYKVAIKKRERNKKALIYLIMVCLMLWSLVAVGEMNVNKLYLLNKFNWNIAQINTFNAISNAVTFIFTFTLTFVLYKKLKIKEIFLVLLSSASAIVGTLMFALGTNSKVIYASAAVRIFSGLASPMLRTFLGRSLDPSEVGKMFSLVSLINTIEMLISSLLYMQIYENTVNSHQESYLYLSIGVFAVVVLIALLTMFLESRSTTLPNADAEKDDDDDDIINNVDNNSQ